MTNKFATIALTFGSATSVVPVLHAQLEVPRPTGRYSVGRQSFVWTDSTRRDPTDSTRWRQVSAFVWYPAAIHKSRVTEAPLPTEWETRRLESLRTKLGPDIASAMTEFKVRSAAPQFHGCSARLGTRAVSRSALDEVRLDRPRAWIGDYERPRQVILRSDFRTRRRRQRL